jgi:4-hydroxy-3-polyprenylbenzoate decarboxylase
MSIDSNQNLQPSRLIVAISGASGVIYGIRLLDVLRTDPAIETHLILSDAAKITIAQETNWKISDIEALAGVVHKTNNVGASIASGSFSTLGMIVAPCSIKSLSAIAHSYADDLLTRAADVQLKEGRPLILMVRETPLHLGHLRLMVQAAEIGAIIMPPVPAFYSHPQSLDEIINGTVGRMLLRVGIQNEHYYEWPGLRGNYD